MLPAPTTPGGETGEQKSAAGVTVAAPRHTVDGATFALLLAAPIIPIAYPAMGYTVLGVWTALYGLALVAPWSWAFSLVLALLLALGAPYWSMLLERRMVSSRVYLAVRRVLRITSTFGFAVGLAIEGRARGFARALTKAGS